MDITKFINSFFPPFSNQLEEIYASKGGPPAVPPETARLLAFLLTLKKPKNALEIGCSFGFSACLTASCMAHDGKVTTIERNPALFNTARENFDKLGFAGRITLLEGDALEILPQLCEQSLKYDFIFMDAAKGQYVNFFPHCISLLNSNGVLAADNIFCKGFVTDERVTIPRRHRTTHDRMREFLRLITNDDRLQTSIIPIGDGLSLSVKH
jgi:predicted O-methyltransferase YrrM